MQLVACDTAKDDDMYDDAILLGEKLMIIRTCLEPDMLMAVDREMEDAAAFAFQQVMGCMLNDDETDQPEKLTRMDVQKLYLL